ncbi:Uncharacterized protein TCM_044828 [Theobroma cacao]|uniref:Peptidase S8/S53 domain-containing protein n=1 Tax=Theobroma cacao TaxID=3641 RepID=A0A061FRK1_THECC|nr:Uncharacterized protein TCM_044828 [Theobroma cacao]
MLVQQSMFKFRKFIMDEEERERIEDEEKVVDEEKAKKVIGIIDTGINVNHECFEDKHLPILEGKKLQIPFRRKFVALENFTKAKRPTIAPALLDYNFPEDLNGHGTACASIAAGTLIELEWLKDIYGVSNTRIQGANPFARIASYKVNGSYMVLDKSFQVLKSSLLDAIKKAIADKVDVILVALATDVKQDRASYLFDPVNLGGYLAMKENILLCTSSGNKGDDYFTLSGGLAPWVLTVGSCNSGGKFITNIELGDALKLKGYGAFIDTDGHACELIDYSECFEQDSEINKGKGIAKGVDAKERGKQIEETYPKRKKTIKEETQPQKKDWKIREEVVEGRIIYYNGDRIWPINAILDAKVAGVICVDDGMQFRSYELWRPVVYVKDGDGQQIVSYIENNSKFETKAKARIYKTVYEEEDEEVCRVSYESGKGPNSYDSYVLKPDICAPGEDILCASKYDMQNMYAHYSVMSGTSMASAVTVGLISYIRAIHKNWGPARIKSAIMTSAKSINKPADMDVLGYGNECLNPLKAIDPGLVYDISLEEFRRYLLNLDGDKEYLSSNGENIQGEEILGMDLNLPNFSLVLDERSEYIFNRTLTNVGSSQCSYKAKIIFHPRFFTNKVGRALQERFPRSIDIRVEPDVLEFNNIEQQRCFRLIVRSSGSLGNILTKVMLVRATLVWQEQKERNGRDQPHSVSSPIIIMSSHLWRLRPPIEKIAHDSMLPKKRFAEQGDVATSKGKQKAIKIGLYKASNTWNRVREKRPQELTALQHKFSTLQRCLVPLLRGRNISAAASSSQRCSAVPPYQTELTALQHQVLNAAALFSTIATRQ